MQTVEELFLSTAFHSTKSYSHIILTQTYFKALVDSTGFSWSNCFTFVEIIKVHYGINSGGRDVSYVLPKKLTESWWLWVRLPMEAINPCVLTWPCQIFSCMCMHLLIRTPIVHTCMHPIAPRVYTGGVDVCLIFGMLYLISHCCMDFLLLYSYRLPA